MEENENVNANVNLTLNINGEFHIHHHHHHSSAQPGAADILNSIQDLKGTIMTQLDLSAAKETQDTQSLVAAVTAMATALEQLRSTNNSGLQAALDASNLDSAQQAAILDANDSAVEAALAAANTALNPPTGGDTTGGTAGNDTVSAGGGTDTNVGGQGSDTVSGTDVLLIGTTEFDNATVGVAFTGDVQINQGTAPYSVTSSPPSQNGLAVGTDGTISGTPSSAGSFSFVYSVSDSATPPNAGSGTVLVVVAEAVQAV